MTELWSMGPQKKKWRRGGSIGDPRHYDAVSEADPHPLSNPLSSRQNLLGWSGFPPLLCCSGRSSRDFRRSWLFLAMLIVAVLMVSLNSMPIVMVSAQGAGSGVEVGALPSLLVDGIPAVDWNVILGTRWSQWPAFTRLTKVGLGLIQLEVDTLYSTSSSSMEQSLNGRATTFLARYNASMTDIAYYVLHSVTGGSASVVPVTGCCGEFEHFFIYTNLTVVNVLKSHSTKVFVAIEALPAFAKVEPAVLSKALDEYAPWSAGGYGGSMPEPASIKVVLASGAASSVAEAEAYGLEMVRNMPAKPFPSRALSAEVLLLGPVTKTILPVVVRHVSERPEVLRILPSLPYEKHNQWSKAVVQNPAPFNFTPLYDYNLTGINQIVALTDTGIQVSHCFFADESQGTPTTLANSLQRKIVMYDSVADGSDTPEGGEFGGGGGGHGTFIAGVIAGAPLPSNEGTTNERALTLKFSGVARDSKLAFYDIGDSENNLSGLQKRTLKELLLDSIWQNASVHVVPFGVGNTSSTSAVATQLYDLDARDVDDVSFHNEEFLVVVSAGNGGAQGLYTLTSPAVSKNAIAVGASLNTKESLQFCASYCAPVFCKCADNLTVGTLDPLYLSHFSSKGPTLDGRIKPDVVAPGMHMWSALASDPAAASNGGESSCRLTSSQGTSTAAGVVGGVAALVRQYFTEGRYPTGSADRRWAFSPSGALVKACIIHGARGLLGYIDAQEGFSFRKFPPSISYPNVFEGWGLVRLDRVLMLPALPSSMTTSVNEHAPHSMFIKSGRTDGAVLLPGEVHSYSFTLRRAVPLRITLVWMDPPAVIGAMTPVVHDLDLAVIHPHGSITYPNGLSAPDRINNVERVVITHGIAGGKYTITVSAVTVLPALHNGQSYALVVTGDFFRLPSDKPVITRTPRLRRPPPICFFGSGISRERDAANTTAGAVGAEVVAATVCPRLAGDNYNDTSLPIHHLTSPPSTDFINNTEASVEIGGFALFGDIQVQSENAATTNTVMTQTEVVLALSKFAETPAASQQSSGATGASRTWGTRRSSSGMAALFGGSLLAVIVVVSLLISL